MGNDCPFCFGKGKVGLNPCTTCKGERRILGKQKLTKIKLTGDETKIDAMGHCSKTEPGKVGYLLLIKGYGDAKL
jgi:DnaJ-class molecular chaperone